MMNKRMISVVIPTKNRPKHIDNCIESLLKSSFKNFEIIIVDQSTNSITKKFVLSIKSKNIRYVHTSIVGKSKALNKAIEMSRGDILALIDDDCIVDTHWLKNIDEYFYIRKDIVGVFGKTQPYKPERHKSLICPATFTKRVATITSNPKDIFYVSLGQGNNMSFRKVVFDKIGSFNINFGPGAKIPTAEDCEFIYRILLKGYPLAYSPDILIYHNNWITPIKESELQIQYTTGICASGIYLALCFRDIRCTNLIIDRFQKYVLNTFKHKVNLPIAIVMLRQLKAILRGIYLGVNLYRSL